MTAKKQSSLKFTGLLMIGALIGKILGFVREVLFARLLGASIVADSFRGAMTAVLLPISPLQGDMIPSTLVPLHAQWSSENKAPVMFASLALMFGTISTFFACIAIVFAPSYVNFLVGGFTEEAKVVTVSFLRIMALAMPASVLIGCFACIELSLGRSRLTSIRASVQNVAVIAGIVIMYWTHNPIGIAWGFTIAFNCVALLGLVTLQREGHLAPSEITIANGYMAFKELFVRVRPLIIQPIFDQTNIVIEKLLSSALVVGSVASLDYARTLTDTAVYLVSQPVGYVILGQSANNIKNQIKIICRPVLSLALPASVFIIIFAVDIVSIVFQRGAFQEHAIQLTSYAVQGITFGLWASTLGWILIRFLNVQKRNKTAAKIFVAAYMGNILINYISYKELGIFGIGLGEATKGIILLFGTSYALRCSKLLIGLIIQCLPIVMVLIIASLLIHMNIMSPYYRILYASIVFSLITFPWIYFYVPEISNIIKKKFALKNC